MAYRYRPDDLPYTDDPDRISKEELAAAKYNVEYYHRGKKRALHDYPQERMSMSRVDYAERQQGYGRAKERHRLGLERHRLAVEKHKWAKKDRPIKEQYRDVDYHERQLGYTRAKEKHRWMQEDRPKKEHLTDLKIASAERKYTLDELNKERLQLKNEYDLETDAQRRLRLKQQLEMNKMQIKNMKLQQRSAFRERIRLSVPEVISMEDGRRQGIRYRMQRLEKAFGTLPSDPFHKVNVNKLGVDGFGSNLFKFRTPKMDINEGYRGNFDNLFFGRKKQSKKYRRYRYNRRKRFNKKYR